MGAKRPKSLVSSKYGLKCATKYICILNLWYKVKTGEAPKSRSGNSYSFFLKFKLFIKCNFWLAKLLFTCCSFVWKNWFSSQIIDKSIIMKPFSNFRIICFNKNAFWWFFLMRYYEFTIMNEIKPKKFILGVIRAGQRFVKERQVLKINRKFR